MRDLAADQARATVPETMNADAAAQTLGRWSSRLELGALPQAVIVAAKRSLIDVVGVAIAGAAHPTARIVLAHVDRETARGECSVFGSDTRYRPTGAALANGTAAHVLDFDDTSFDGIAHLSAVVFPAVLACAQSRRATGADLLAGFIAGVETSSVLGRVCSNDIYWRGWWTTGVLGAIGAAAGASRALRLPPQEAAHAIGMATTLTFGMRALLGTSTKPVGVGRAAELGTSAALLAAQGIDALSAVFEDPRGFIQAFNGGQGDWSALASLGTRFSLTDPGYAIKRYPACSSVQAAVEVVDELMIEHSLEPADILEIDCAVTPLVAACLEFNDPQTIEQAQFSLPFALACMMRLRTFGVPQLSLATLTDESIRTEMRKTTLRSVRDLVTGADAARYPEAADVTLRLADGRALKRFKGAASGMPSAPFTAAQVEAKFLACATPALGETRARRLLDDLSDVERLKTVDTLFR